MPLILVIDQGTTSTKVHLVDDTAQIVFTSQKEIKRILPKEMFVEQDPEEIWQSVLYCVNLAFQKASELGQKIVSCGIANQRETTVIWERYTGNVVYNAISWQDTRTGEMCKNFSEEDANYIRNTTGLILNPYFSATKIKWIIDTILEGKNLENYAFGTIDSFLVYRLTSGKVHATDTSNISRTLLYDIKNLNYDEKLLQIFGINRCLLPEVRHSIDDYGAIDSKYFGIAIPISSVIGDQQAATIGHCCFDKYDAKVTYGTGCFVMVNVGPRFQLMDSGLLTTILYSSDNKVVYAIEGSIFYAGSAINCARDNLKLFDNYKEAEREISSLDGNGGVYCVPALSGLGTPYWEEKARAIFIGLSNNATKSHMIRSVFESVAYQTYDLLQAIESEAIRIDGLQIDGGMASNEWFNQYLSNILGIDIIKPSTIELTGLGAAYLAGIKDGVFGSFEEIRKLHRIEKLYKVQNITFDERKLVLESWKSAVEVCLSIAKGKL